MRKTVILNPVGGLIVLATIAAITFLTWAAKVNGDAAIALLSAIIGGVLASSNGNGNGNGKYGTS